MLRKLRTYFGPRVSIERIQFAHFFFFNVYCFFCDCVFSAMFSNVLCSFFGLVARLHVNICESVM